MIPHQGNSISTVDLTARFGTDAKSRPLQPRAENSAVLPVALPAMYCPENESVLG
jgi:hypothetical protein